MGFLKKLQYIFFTMKIMFSNNFFYYFQIKKKCFFLLLNNVKYGDGWRVWGGGRRPSRIRLNSIIARNATFFKPHSSTPFILPIQALVLNRHTARVMEKQDVCSVNEYIKLIRI